MVKIVLISYFDKKARATMVVLYRIIWECNGLIETPTMRRVCEKRPVNRHNFQIERPAPPQLRKSLSAIQNLILYNSCHMLYLQATFQLFESKCDQVKNSMEDHYIHHILTSMSDKLSVRVVVACLSRTQLCL